MEDQQVDLVDAELARALLETVQSFVIPVVADPDLGLQEDLRPADVRVANSLADLALVAVGRGGVDEAIARIDCRPDCIARLIRRRLENAETKRGHLDAVVESYVFHRFHSRCAATFDRRRVWRGL